MTIDRALELAENALHDERRQAFSAAALAEEEEALTIISALRDLFRIVA